MNIDVVKVDVVSTSMHQIPKSMLFQPACIKYQRGCLAMPPVNSSDVITQNYRRLCVNRNKLFHYYKYILFRLRGQRDIDMSYKNKKETNYMSYNISNYEPI